MTGRPLLGIVAGMRSELATLGPGRDDPRVALAVSGARPAQAEAEARRLVAERCRVLLSWGIAGGLDPALAPGSLLLAGSVVEESGARHGLWRPGGAEGPCLLGLDRAILEPVEKARLRARTGAAAVDMETHRLARVGAEAGVPVAAIRAVADPAERALPALAADALDAEGRPRLARVALGLLARPGDLPALLRVKADTDRALAALAGAAERIEEILALAASMPERR